MDNTIKLRLLFGEITFLGQRPGEGGMAKVANSRPIVLPLLHPEAVVQKKGSLEDSFPLAHKRWRYSPPP